VELNVTGARGGEERGISRLRKESQEGTSEEKLAARQMQGKKGQKCGEKRVPGQVAELGWKEESSPSLFDFSNTSRGNGSRKKEREVEKIVARRTVHQKIDHNGKKQKSQSRP